MKIVPAISSSRLLSTSWILVSLILVVISGCPQDQVDSKADSTTPITSDQTTTKPDKCDERVIGANWLKLSKTELFINDRLEVEYNLDSGNKFGQPWIAFVPADLESTLTQDNQEAAILFTHLHSFPTDKTSFLLKKDGQFRLRLFNTKENDVHSVFESDIFTVKRSVPDKEQPDPPFISLSSSTLPDEILLKTGMIIAPFWILEEDPGEDGWVGLIPTSVSSDSAKENHDKAHHTYKLDGRIKSFNRFPLDHVGEYAFRVFTGIDEDDTMICESEVFIVEKYPPDPAE